MNRQELTALWPSNVILLPLAQDPTEEDYWTPDLHSNNCPCLICEYPDLVWEPIS